MIKLHPEFLKIGKNEVVVITRKEWAALEEILVDLEDLIELRKAKRRESRKRTIPLSEARKKLGL